MTFLKLAAFEIGVKNEVFVVGNVFNLKVINMSFCSVTNTHRKTHEKAIVKPYVRFTESRNPFGEDIGNQIYDHSFVRLKLIGIINCVF